MSIGTSEVNYKKREKLQQDIARFLENGGEIVQLPYLANNRPKIVQAFSLVNNRAKEKKAKERMGA